MAKKMTTKEFCYRIAALKIREDLAKLPCNLKGRGHCSREFVRAFEYYALRSVGCPTEEIGFTYDAGRSFTWMRVAHANAASMVVSAAENLQDFEF